MPLGPVVWVPVGVALMVAAVLAWRWWTGHRRRPGLHVHAPAVAGARPDPAEAAPEPEFLLTGIEPTLQLLDEPREPADAIVRAWLGLEQSAQESGIVRRPEETPTEFTARILKAAFADDRAVQVLLRLYLRARFGDRPVTSDDVTAVRGILRELVQTWRSSASTATAGPR